MSDEELELDLEDIHSFKRDFDALKTEIARSVKGFDELIEYVLVAIFAGGHVLLEGEPGLGKTLLVKSLARAFGLEFKRIQFTPDLMPADILGTDVLVEDQAASSRELQFRPGPIFTNILLADEINRATPKTQSALLEAMGEGQVTIFGRRYELEQPFFVIATQNPIEMEGTYPLPEAQLDRFFFKLVTPFPQSQVLGEILDLTTKNLEYEALPQPVLSADELANNLEEQGRLKDEISILERNGSPSTELAERKSRLAEVTSEAASVRRGRINRMREVARGAVPTPNSIELILKLIEDLRQKKDAQHLIDYSPGPRAAQSLLLAGKVRSLLKVDSPGFTLPSDVVPNILPALRHRLLLNFEAEAQQQTAESILQSFLDSWPDP